MLLGLFKVHTQLGLFKVQRLLGVSRNRPTRVVQGYKVQTQQCCLMCRCYQVSSRYIYATRVVQGQTLLGLFKLQTLLDLLKLQTLLYLFKLQTLLELLKKDKVLRVFDETIVGLLIPRIVYIMRKTILDRNGSNREFKRNKVFSFLIQKTAITIVLCNYYSLCANF